MKTGNRKFNGKILSFIGFSFFIVSSVTAQTSENIDDAKIEEIVSRAEKVAQRIVARFSGEKGGSGSDTYMGVTIESIPSVLRDYVDLPEGVGLLLPHIANGGPAERAGLKDNDIIYEFDGQLIVNYRQLSTLIDLKAPGDEVNIKVIRKGNELELPLTLGTRDSSQKSWKLPKVPEAPKPPDAPDAPDMSKSSGKNEVIIQGMDEVGTILRSIEQWIPGSVSMYIDDNEQIHVNLEDLKESVRDLKVKIERMKESGESWEDIVKDYGDMGARQTIIRMANKNMNFSNEQGEVLMTHSEAGVNVRVWDTHGELIYEGPLEPSENKIPEKAQELIEAMQESRDKINMNLDESEEFKIELNSEENEPLTMAIHN